jgi:hypothetical protein
MGDTVLNKEGEVTDTSLRKEIFAAAAKHVEQELEALDTLNSRKAISEVADLFEISPAALWYYMEHGEEAAEALFNKSVRGGLSNVSIHGSSE